jgi:hypothetical protein
MERVVECSWEPARRKAFLAALRRRSADEEYQADGAWTKDIDQLEKRREEK